jgi:ascorbate-specific PTS system EIIC-type component UlaA
MSEEVDPFLAAPDSSTCQQRATKEERTTKSLKIFRNQVLIHAICICVYTVACILVIKSSTDTCQPSSIHGIERFSLYPYKSVPRTFTALSLVV